MDVDDGSTTQTDRHVPAPAHPWDGFVTGPENALAHAAVLALAGGGAEDLAPTVLVVHGPSGAGKSRLLRGLVGEWLLRRPSSAVAHLEAEAFASACAAAHERAGDGTGWADLRDRFRTLDLFALDDLQALERAPMALEELTHTLDALADRGAAVAVTAPTGPGHWRGAWPSRLVNRLLGGLAVRVDPPGLAARRRFLLERSRARGVRLAAAAVDALAAAADGYRALDGWLVRLELTARVEDRPIDGPLAQALLHDGDDGIDGPAPADLATLGELARAVATLFGLRLRDLRSASRRQAVAGPRHLAMYLARCHTGLSFLAIGAFFGGRDPATVRHACRAAAARLANDPALAASIAPIRQRWRTVRAPDDDPETPP